jgi:4-amino-4-deoxy-L-arabinose transferase-like glycosyltransferase
MVSLVPLRTVVQIGADEGFELAKATLCLKGHNLYTEVWNDQPPLHTFLTTQVLRYISPSIIAPRLLTVAFSVLLLSAIFRIMLRLHGLFVASISTVLVLASPGFLELATSCMLEIPALALAVVGLRLSIDAGTITTESAASPLNQITSASSPLGKTHWKRFVLSGVMLGLALQTKLVPVIYLALIPVILWFGAPVEDRSLKGLVPRLALIGVSLSIVFIGVEFLIDRGAYLHNFGQSWTSHFSPAKSTEYGAASEHPFKWDVLVKNWDVTVPALIGLSCLFTRPARLGLILPLAWLLLTFVVFGLHRPWWPYYYIHTAIPMCLCAGIGATFLSNRIKSRPLGFLTTVVCLFGAGAICWMGARLYLQVTNLRQSAMTYSSPVIEQINLFQASAGWLYTDKLIYSFHSSIPMVPSLAVVPIKRMWSGEMTNVRLAHELEAYKPGVIALVNDGRDVPFKDLLDRDYQLVYMDPENRVYALKTIARKRPSTEH